MKLPLSVSYECPFGTGPIVLHKEDVLAALRPNVSDYEVASLYAEVARFERAAQLESDKAEARFRAWKAKVSAAFREEKGKATVAQVEEHYRNRPDYVERATEANAYSAQASLLGDIKKAFEIKARLINSLSHDQRSQETVLRADGAGGTSLSDLQREAQAAVLESGSIEAAAEAAGKAKS